MSSSPSIEKETTR